MKTKQALMTIAFLCGIAALVGAAEQPRSLTFTAEIDKPVLLADTPQTVYLRIGLKGCSLEQLNERPPVNVAIVIDKSGSMHGERIHHARQAAILAIQRLNSSDIASIIVYNSQAQVLVPATKMTRRDEVIQKIRQIEAGGMTALYAGVKAAAHEAEKFQSPGRVNRIILLSDGQANVGPQTPEALGRLGAQLAGQGLSVTTIGLGLGYNEDLMTRLAYKSDGGHYFAESPHELASVFDREFDRALSVVAQEIRIEITLPKSVKPIRLLGREGKIEQQTILVDMGNIYSEHEKYILLEARINPLALPQNTLSVADINVQYRRMKDAEMQKAAAQISAKLTTDTEAVAQNLNARVTADVVEQIAIERNERATALRVDGKL